MNIPVAQVRENVSSVEWETRVNLAACYRLMDLYGMTDMVYNHISARIPGTEHLLINAYGYLYSEVTASNLITIDLEGQTVLQPDTELGYTVNPAGALIHTAVHKARADVGCVIHIHTRARAWRYPHWRTGCSRFRRLHCGFMATSDTTTTRGRHCIPRSRPGFSAISATTK